MNKIIELSEIMDNYITEYSNSLSTKTRNKKLICKKKTKFFLQITDISDGIIFSLLYTQKNVTKDQITAYYNSLTNNTASRKAYYMRCNQISLDFLEKLYNVVTEYINKNIYKKPKYNIYACDGCKINTSSKLSNYGYKINESNNSCTVLTIAVYNIINCNILNLYSVKHKNERLAFTENTFLKNLRFFKNPFRLTFFL